MVKFSLCFGVGHHSPELAHECNSSGLFDSPYPRTKRRKTVAWLVVLFSGVSFVLSGCGSKEKAAAVIRSEVEFVEVEQKDVPLYSEWVGTLAGDVNASIMAQVSGYLTNRAYVEGSTVTNGQILFQIDGATFEATLVREKANLTTAEARKVKTALDVQRYTPLAATEAISRQELDDAIQMDKAAAAQVESARAAVHEAELNLGFTTIRAPIDGVAGLAKAQLGDLVGPSTGPLTTVTKINPMRANFSISEQLVYSMMVRRLSQGETARQQPPLELIMASGDVYPHKGQIRFSDNRVDVKTGTIEVVGEFPNPNNLLSAGMFARVRALVGVQTNALLVPQRAVAEMQGKYLIALIGADSKISIRPVTVGERTATFWIVDSKQLKPGDRVVAEGIQKVKDGIAVSPVALGTRSKPQLAQETKKDVKTE
jgi:membrane fusion protein, multidrug efflux system